jgi:hypothetical protein
VIAFLAGLLLYGFSCYRVLTAGGLSATSLRPTCSKAAIGSETRDYRADESVHIRRSYLPPTAVCQWSGGATAALIPANALSWAGPVSIAARRSSRRFRLRLAMESGAGTGGSGRRDVKTLQYAKLRL